MDNQFPAHLHNIHVLINLFETLSGFAVLFGMLAG